MPAKPPRPTYTHRAHAITPERTYELMPGALTWRDEGEAKVHRLALRDIAAVHLAYRPVRLQSERYQVRIMPRSGPPVTLSNLSFDGFARFRVDNEGYSAFLRALHDRLAETGSTATFRMGSSIIGYALNVLLTAGVAVALAVFLWVLVANGSFGVLLLAVAVTAFLLPSLYRFMIRSKPGRYDPRALPETALPA